MRWTGTNHRIDCRSDPLPATLFHVGGVHGSFALLEIHKLLQELGGVEVNGPDLVCMEILLGAAGDHALDEMVSIPLPAFDG